MTQAKIVKYGTYVLMLLTAVGFGAAGLAKLAGVEVMHQPFAVFGLPATFGYIAGLLEVAGAIALFVRPVRVPAAVGLGVTGLDAFAFHALFTPIDQGVPALILTIFSALLVLSFHKQGADV